MFLQLISRDLFIAMIENNVLLKKVAWKRPGAIAFCCVFSFGTNLCWTFKNSLKKGKDI